MNFEILQEIVSEISNKIIHARQNNKKPVFKRFEMILCGKYYVPFKANSCFPLSSIRYFPLMTYYLTISNNVSQSSAKTWKTVPIKLTHKLCGYIHVYKNYMPLKRGLIRKFKQMILLSFVESTKVFTCSLKTSK